jgi:hypothetical protein
VVVATTDRNNNCRAPVRRGPAALVVLVLLAALVAVDAGAARLDSGVAGVVLAGQTCRDVKSCRGQADVVVRVFKAPSGDWVRTVRTSPQGRFRIALPAGRYVLRVILVQPGGTALKSAQGVRVQPNRFTLVVIRLGAGPRPRPTR